MAKETSPEAIDRLTAELATAKQTIASFQAEKKELDKIEQMIAEKMKVGLTRGQAMSVLAQQEAFDKYEQAKLASDAPSGAKKPA
jgi:t-SNARE complex subunit (syntaxin)